MTEHADDLLPAIEALGERLAAARAMIARRIVGQEDVVELAIVSMLSGGHALLFGVPGVGKTRLVETLSVVMGLSSNRIQFTPDLMPADILGSEILQTGADGFRGFRFVQGPVFCQLLMADEINRASPRTQSALLQAMQENTVSIAGDSHALPMPFHVLATQNPIELEGTYPLPEAQLDRFLVRINIDYPDRAVERGILETTTGLEELAAEAVLDPAAMLHARRVVRRMPVGEAIVENILDIVRSCRPDAPEATDRVRNSVEWGPGPRATQSLMLAVRARALLQGRLAPSQKDVSALARPALSHRMKLSFASRARGESVKSVIDDAAQRVSGCAA